MHNIDQVIRRLRLSGSGVAMSQGEMRMLFLHLIQKVENLENEISLCRSKTCGSTGESVSSSEPKLRGRKGSSPKAEPSS